jgi:hypothetical protein
MRSPTDASLERTPERAWADFAWARALNPGDPQIRQEYEASRRSQKGGR